MHIISYKKIREANVKYPKSKNALISWYKVMKKIRLNNFSEIKKVFGSTDKVGNLYVFDVGGNKVRIVAAIHFNRNKIYIRGIYDHAEYDKGNWKKERNYERS